MPKTKNNQPSQTRFEIAVTQADIDRAFQSNSAKCVVAQAIARTLPTAHRIEVDTQTIRFTLGDERYAYLTPYSVTGYVIGFDAGDEIHPFRFRLYQDQKVPVRVRKRTAAGAETNNVQRRARTVKAKAEAAQQKLDAVLAETEGAFTDPSLPPPTPAQVKAVRTEARAAEAAAKAADEQVASVKAAYAEAAKSEVHNAGRTAPRVFKTNRRHYGHRALRINQQTS